MENIGRLIQNNTALKKLELHEWNIDDDSAVSLVKSLPESHLEVSEINDNSLGDHTCASLLSFIPSTLTKLSIIQNKMTEASLRTILTFLATNRTLKIPQMKYNPIFEKDDSDGHENVYWQQISEVAKQNGICELDSFQIK